ncbi:penicillin-binding transpeptidase domain-containing protein [Myxococcaceae bacterium GXIMD 01537]
MTVSRRLLSAALAPLALLLGAMSSTPEAPTAPAATEPAPAPAAQGAPAAEAVAAPPVEEFPEGLLPPVEVPSRQSAPPLAEARPLPLRDDWLTQARLEKGEYTLKRKVDGVERTERLTIDPLLQASLTRILKDYDVPYGAAVVVEPSTGRVLALAEHSSAQPGLRGLATRAVFPAASIFKIVTGSALLEAGVTPETETCFHGGKRRLTEKHLEDSERDGSCYSLGLAMGKSANVIFAKLTHKHLTAEILRRMAARYHFNRELAFPFPAEVSLARIPDEGFALANTGAGFGDVYLSPLHGALIASVAANGGVWKDPILFEAAAPDPAVAAPMTPVEPERVMTPEAARALTGMLEETVTHGTARHIFRERNFRVDDAVGKTGSLADKNPFRDYSWFVGFAPKENPRVAVAAVIVNGPLWRIRGTYLGREALRLGLQHVPAPVVLTAPAGNAGAP